MLKVKAAKTSTVIWTLD